MEPYLVPGRSCGECTVCCVSLWIDDPELRKEAGDPCVNLTSAGLCGIYEDRPRTCRLFYCGWRQLRWIDGGMRPDLSGVLIRVRTASEGEQAGLCLGVAFLLLDRAALDSDELARAVAATVAAGLPVTLDVPGAGGRGAVQIRVDEALRSAVWARDNEAVLVVLKQAHAQGEASNLAASGPTNRDDASHLGHASDVC